MNQSIAISVNLVVVPNKFGTNYDTIFSLVGSFFERSRFSQTSSDPCGVPLNGGSQIQCLVWHCSITEHRRCVPQFSAPVDR